MKPRSTMNELGQPIGSPVLSWQPPPPPARSVLHGRWCSLEPIDPDRHAEGLFDANRLDTEGRSWTYLSYGPFESVADYRAWMEQFCLGDDPMFFAVRDDETDRFVGVASYLRIDRTMGSIEVGHVCYSLLLRQRRAGTEAMYLLMKNAFDLGYRRYEWKCDALNEASMRAARRLGFRYEGTFRQALIYKRRNRDTAWFSVVDREWPELRQRFDRWLEPGNFDVEGNQLSGL